MLPTSMAQANPDLAKAIAKQFHQGPSPSSIKPLVSAGGTAFTSFAKSADFNAGQCGHGWVIDGASAADLYDGLVAPTLGASLLVETWRRGDEIPLACHNSQTVLDVQNVHVLQSNAYHYTKDHSKFAVSTVGTKPFVCIGDINRMVWSSVK
jgi:deoxyribonuclease-2